MFRFIHSGDLHLGKRFGNMPEDLRGRLREARHAALGRLARAAVEHGADTILLAGDTFDTETPSPEIRRQALAEIGHHAQLRWILLPGNHDSLQAAQLWDALRHDAPPNLLLATDPAPIALAPGAFLLPAPCTARRPGRDLSGWMDSAATADTDIRIGLAHGAVQSFSEEGGTLDVIAPDRAARAGLDYLALGDWHGPVSVNERTHYPGTPEPDRFKHDRPGQALVVTISGRNAAPTVTPVETGSFAWRTIALPLMSQEDGAALLASVLPAGPVRRQTLLRVVASGRTGLAGRTALKAAFDLSAPEFAHLHLDERDLATDCESGDLDRIDRGGALREAADLLLAESADTGRTPAEREIARGALVRLFSYAEKIAP